MLNSKSLVVLGLVLSTVVLLASANPIPVPPIPLKWENVTVHIDSTGEGYDTAYVTTILCVESIWSESREVTFIHPFWEEENVLGYTVTTGGEEITPAPTTLTLDMLAPSLEPAPLEAPPVFLIPTPPERSEREQIVEMAKSAYQWEITLLPGEQRYIAIHYQQQVHPVEGIYTFQQWAPLKGYWLTKGGYIDVEVALPEETEVRPVVVGYNPTPTDQWHIGNRTKLRWIWQGDPSIIEVSYKVEMLPTIEVEEITIGDGANLCYNFAIFADPQVVNNTTKLQEAITEVNNNPDVKFVIVLGDLIQGEAQAPNQYETGFNIVKGKLGDLNVPWIPMIGNHDVWCNLTGNDIVFPSGYTIPPYDPGATPRYPEQIFNEVFSGQYETLANMLLNWRKQEGMPIRNPHASAYPDIYFQNFAFDFGPYHFICLDFCSRKDFDNIAYDIPPLNNIPIFGYADLHDFTTNDGTLNWLNNHLASLSTQQRQNIILFTHHPLVYRLQQVGIITLDGDNTFCFDESIEGEYTKLKNLLNTHGCNIIHWFSGHYHLKGSNWGDGTNIICWHDANIGTAGSDISIIPSTMICSNFGGQDIPEGTPGTINDLYSGNFEPNRNGSLAIVRVLSEMEVDVMIRDCPWDDGSVPSSAVCENGWIHLSPDIWITSDPAGNNKIHNPILDKDNYLWSRVWNIGCQNATNIKVKYYWADYGTASSLNWREDHFPSGNEKTIDFLRPGEYSEQCIVWEPKDKKIATEHRCIFVTLTCADDPNGSGQDTNWDNNIGWRNFCVEELKKKIVDSQVFYEAAVDFKVGNPDDEVKDVWLDLYLEDWPEAWAVELTSPDPRFRPLPDPVIGYVNKYVFSSMEAGEEGDVTLNVIAPAGTENDTGTVHIAGTIDNRPIGGISVQVVPPINTCYVDFANQVNTCQLDGIVWPYEPNGGINWALSQAVMKINMANHQALEMKIEVQNPGGDWLLNIGNSPSNNGAGGDGGDFSNDSELDITLDTEWKLRVYGNDYSTGAGIPRPLLVTNEFITREFIDSGKETIRVKIGDERLWIKSEVRGNEAALFDNEYIFRLGATDDECGCEDYQYYAAFNRTIGSSWRTGTGVTKVTFLWSDTWTWDWEIPDL